VDFAMPRRFDVRYVDAGGERKLVAMLHRALFGSIERFLGVLLEHHGAVLPAWLAPEQVAIVPIAARHRGYAERIRAALGVRARIDADDTLARRVAIAHRDGVPLVAIVGDRDVASEAISIRERTGQVTLPFDGAIAHLRERCSA
jgi:threonyl-tRNA synthetase